MLLFERFSVCTWMHPMYVGKSFVDHSDAPVSIITEVFCVLLGEFFRVCVCVCV
jgi:hypothetical protein